MSSPAILNTKYARPLEREFEAWIVREIEDYFTAVGVQASIWAVSPTLEKTWPADEVLGVTGKVVGLQFKQAQLAPGTQAHLGPGIVDFDRIKWSLRQPKGQYELVQRRQEIFYALPTFINREWSRVSLHHCLFWRPPASSVDHNAWYDNPNAQTPHKELVKSGSLRWGELFERVVRCEAGLRVQQDFRPRQYVAQLADIAAETAETDIVLGEENDVTPTSLLFLIHIPLG